MIPSVVTDEKNSTHSTITANGEERHSCGHNEAPVLSVPSWDSNASVDDDSSVASLSFLRVELMAMMPPRKSTPSVSTDSTIPIEGEEPADSTIEEKSTSLTSDINLEEDATAKGDGDVQTSENDDAVTSKQADSSISSTTQEDAIPTEDDEECTEEKSQPTIISNTTESDEVSTSDDVDDTRTNEEQEQDVINEQCPPLSEDSDNGGQSSVEPNQEDTTTTQSNIASLENESKCQTSQSDQDTRKKPKKPIDTTPLVSSEVRKSVALDAAEVGQFTRLREHVIESLSEENIQEDNFFIKSGVHTQTSRSVMFQCINEAAAMGTIKQKVKPHEIVTNDTKAKEEDLQSHEAYVARFYSAIAESKAKVTKNPEEMVDVYVDNERREKMKRLLDAELAVDKIEAHSILIKKFKDDQVELPTAKVPQFKKPVCYMTGGRLKNSVILSAAEGAHERRMRITTRKQLRVRDNCKCLYCKHPSPFQTQSYQKLRMKQGWSDDSLEAEAAAMEDFTGPLSPPPSSRGSVQPNTIEALTMSPQPLTPTAESDIPAAFKDTSSKKNHVKAWKARAAQARKEHYAKGRSLSTVSDGTGTRTLERQHSDVVLSPRGLSRGTSWGATSPIPPRPPSTSPKPAWATGKGVKLRKAQMKDSKSRQKELEDSRHQPSWAAGKDFLLQNGGYHVQPGQSLVSPRKVDSLAMTEHSPMRQGMRHRVMKRGMSLDDEIDEEALLRQELLAEENFPNKTSHNALGSNSTLIEDSESNDDDDDFEF